MDESGTLPSWAGSSSELLGWLSSNTLSELDGPTASLMSSSPFFVGEVELDILFSVWWSSKSAGEAGSPFIGGTVDEPVSSSSLPVFTRVKPSGSFCTTAVTGHGVSLVESPC